MTSISRRSALGGGLAFTLAAPAIAAGGSNVLRYVPAGDLFSLDSLYSAAAVSTVAQQMVFDTLYSYDNALTPQPQMAAGHTVSADNLVWRITLRDGLKFHDGTPVRAEDAVATIARWSQRAPTGVALAKRTEALRAIDDRTLEIRLSKPFAPLLDGLCLPGASIMPARIAGTVNAFTEVKEIVGSGPFIYLADERVPGAHYAFRRNPDYVPRTEAPSSGAGAHVVNVERVEWTVIPDPITAADALRRNEVDWLGEPSLDLLALLRRTDGVRVDATDPLGWSAYMAVNRAAAPFNNPAIARALLGAVDQGEFMQSIVGDQPGLSRTGVGVFNPISPLANDAGMDVLTAPRDAARVRAALKQAGYNGETVVLLSPADRPPNAAMAAVAQQMMQQVGMVVDLQSTDFGTMVTRINGRGNTSWSAVCYRWSGINSINPSSHRPLLGYGDDPAMQALIDGWFDTPEMTAQRAAARAIQLRAFDHPPVLPLGQQYAPIAYRDSITGILPGPNQVFWNLRKA